MILKKGYVADMKIVVFRLAKALGLFALSRWLTRRGLRILCYHGIWLGEGHYGNFLFMSPEVFAGRMAFLTPAGDLTGIYEKALWPQLEALGIASATTIEQGFNFAGAPPLGLKRLLDGQEVQLIDSRRSSAASSSSRTGCKGRFTVC